jgi:two-component system OmpR family sensor kinase
MPSCTTLRGRLVAALLVVVTAGMVALAGITYAEQRSFLYDRTDEQARAAIGAAERGPDGDGLASHGPGDRGVGLPLGTDGERHAASGQVTSARFLGEGVLDSSTLVAPRLPADPPVGGFETISSAGVRYRVHAERAPDGDVTVVAVPLREVDQNLSRLLWVEGLVLGAVLLLIAAVAWAIVRVGLLPLERIGHAAGRIAAGDLSHRVEQTDRRSEVGRLGLAFNAMLDRLEEAFRRREASERRLRRFLADASHELRTPLASIRGYAELYRIGAARAPAETGKSMRRIEDEAARMGVLVEDLLTLARLDQVAEVPYADVDLPALARDAVGDARATAPERHIELEAEAAVVHGDAHQLRQVLANLLRNAVVHTPAGTPTEVTVGSDGAHARLVVRDHGPGLPGDGREIFERFWRAEGGRERGKAGAGLGLAIVDGIVSAHGGRVTAADAAGGGARFTVELPDAQARASSTRLNGLSAARRQWPKPASANTAASRCSPACAPSTSSPPSEIAWAQQTVVEAE